MYMIVFIVAGCTQGDLDCRRINVSKVHFHVHPGEMQGFTFWF